MDSGLFGYASVGTAMFEWGDIRYFLAVARSGSTLAAAALTGSSQSTVTRRLAALEEALGLKLFERLQTGSRLTDQGQALVPEAEKAEAAMAAIAEAADLAHRRLSGVIRFTMAQEGADRLIGEPIAEFMQQHPGVRIEMLLTDQFLDIGAGQADVALRAGPRPSDPNLVARKLSDVHWAGFCAPSYLDRQGRPAGYDDLAGHKVIGPDGQLAKAPPLVRLAQTVPEFTFRASSIRGMASFAKTGMGIALLPDGFGQPEEGLVRCLPALPGASSEVWLLTRQDIRHAPHVRAFLDFIAAHLIALRRLSERRETSTAAPA